MEEEAQEQGFRLADVRFFAPATTRGLARLEQRTELIPYPAGTSIFEEGDPPSHLFVVRSGLVEVFRVYDDGEVEVQRTLGKGELLGELGILGGHARTAGARAVEPSELWAIHREAFLELYESEPPVTLEIATTLARYLLDADAVAEDLLGLTLEGRVAKRLLAMSGNPGTGVHPATGTEQMSREQVAETLQELARQKASLEAEFDNMEQLALLSGGTRATVAGILAGFEREGLVVTAEGNVILLDEDELAVRAGLA